MSDYLSNLAARSLGQADVVRPRPVPLFAPPPRVAGWPPVEQAEDLEPVDREQRPADPRPPVFQAAASQAEPQATPRPTVSSLAPPIGWSPLVLPTDRATPPAADVAAPPSWAGEPQRRPALEPASERVIVERLIAPAPALAVTHAETGPIEKVVERIVTPAVHPAPATSVPAHVTAPPRSAPAPVVVTPPPRSAPAPVIVKPRVAPAPAALASAQAPTQPEPATPEPAPIIQVTIGRIEVRATPPPSQPARGARPAGPALSLDEYLRSRSGGSR
jgi:hypothetical protein